MRFNALARADATPTRRDAAWHEGEVEVAGSDFPPTNDNTGERSYAPPVKNGLLDIRSGDTLANPGVRSVRPAVAVNNTAKIVGRRINPRSPRTALEPEQVMMPMRQFKRAHNPFFVLLNVV